MTDKTAIPEHIQKQFDEARKQRYDTAQYWKYRCRYLEKSIDPTYSDYERNNCRNMYLILIEKGP